VRWPLNDDSYRALVSLTTKVEGRVFQTRFIKTAYNNAVGSRSWDDVNFHTLRHPRCILGGHAGRDLEGVTGLLGHSSLAMTMRYAHLAGGAPPHGGQAAEGLTNSRRAETPTQGSTQEPSALVRSSQNSSK